ncbi:DnaD domain-containing protein [Levilactobacillus wangkuiensis]|uniref:DnaD domain-containing protein n=1 Tax=Levilactobacillus wangkuiensis TaxID=2799566 RepID=UPI00194DB1F3|nr:DnaD domain protein [Levilactobacillus wangkuiensis]
MNYLIQIKAFYDRLEVEPLKSSEIALWYALMSINNKTAWSKTFTVASSVLCQKSGIKEANFYKARNLLQQKGYIEWKSRTGNQAAIYHLPKLYNQVPTNSVDSHIDSWGDSSIDTSIDSSRALNKLNKTKQNDEDDGAVTRGDVIDKWTNLWSFPNAIARPEIDEWLKEFPTEVVDFAITIAGEHRVKASGALNYLRAVIEGWQKRKITTLEQAKKAADEHDKRMKSEYTGHSHNPNRTKETLPGWAQRDSDQPKAPAKKLSAEQQAELDERIRKLSDKNKKQEA